MSRKTMGVTVTDLFCGAGGSSLGAAALGAEIRWGLNHWDRAIETHSHNFPNARHERTDIRAADPTRYESTDILFASPECVNHSLAKGVARRRQQGGLWGEEPDPGAERSRATMWDVPRFAEVHGYNIIIVENVVEARKWVMWDSWIHAMTVSLGYDYQIVYLNSMFAWPTPQSRDRMYVVFHKRGNARPDLDIRPLAPCRACGKNVEAVQSWKSRSGVRWGRYRQQYVYCCPQCGAVVEPYYYCAANAIDWALPIERIGDRRQPLKPKTIARIEEGLRRFAGRPFGLTTNAALIHRNLHELLADVWPTQTSAKTQGVVVPPFAFVHDQSRIGTNVRALDDVLPTMTTATTTSVCVPPPFVFSQGAWDNVYRGMDEELPSATTSRYLSLVSPFVVEVGHGGPENAGRLKHISEALPTAHTMGGVGVVIPLSHGGDEGRARELADALPTQTARQDLALAMAPFIAELHGTSSARSVEDAMGCVTAGGNHHGLVSAPPFLTSYYGSDDGAHAVTDALGTQSTVDRHALVEPGRLPTVEECGFRVLKPHEIQAAMAFPRDYVVTGTNREKIKQLGNAVTPPAMSLLWERCLATLRSERIA